MPNLTKSYSEMEIENTKFILHPKSIIVLIWCQIFVVKRFFLSKDKKTYFHIESVVYSYKNILEELSNYSSLSMNDYTDILYFIESNGFAYL